MNLESPVKMNDPDDLPRQGNLMKNTAFSKDDQSFEKEGWKTDDQLYESFLDKAGGLGKFQLFTVLSFFFAIDGINFILYELSYLEILPEKYLCTYAGSPVAVPCTPDDFCGQDSSVVSW